MQAPPDKNWAGVRRAAIGLAFSLTAGNVLIMENSAVRWFREEEQRRKVFRDIALGIDRGLVGEVMRTAQFRANMLQNLNPGIGLVSKAMQDSNGFAALTKQAEELSRTSRGISEAMGQFKLVNQAEFQNANRLIAEQLEGLASVAKSMEPALSLFKTFPIPVIDDRVQAAAQRYWDEVEEAGPADHTSIPEAVSGIIARLNDNQRKQFAEWSWYDWIVALVFLFEVFRVLSTALVDDADNVEMQAHIEQIEEGLQGVTTALQAMDTGFADAERIAGLDRAIVLQRANVRADPKREGDLLVTLKQGESVAILKTQGKWVQVVYRDSLTNTLQQGWIWRQSLGSR